MGLIVPEIQQFKNAEPHVLAAAASPGDVVRTVDLLTGVVVGVNPGKTQFAAGDEVAVCTEGIARNVPALSSATWSAGAIIGWDATNRRAVATGGTHALGYARTAKTNGQTRCDVRLVPVQLTNPS